MVPAGEQFASEGQRLNRVYVVRSGLGLRSRTLPDGRRQVLDILFPGDIVGLQAVLLGQLHHSAEARSDMVLSVIDQRQLSAHWQQRSDIVMLSLKMMAATEVRLMQAMLSIAQHTAEEAIAALLYSIFRRGAVHGMVKGQSMPFPFRQTDIADALGLSLVHTNKTLTKLRRGGILYAADGRLTLQDAETLARAYIFDAIDDGKNDARP